MARYRMEDETVVDTARAKKRWNEARDWDGRNYVSRATSSQWEHETLYQTEHGRYVLVQSSNVQGTLPCAVWVGPQEAARWLIHNEHELPCDLETYEIWATCSIGQANKTGSSGDTPLPPPPISPGKTSSRERTSTNSDFLTVQVFAERLGVNHKVVRREIKKKNLKAVRVGRLLKIPVSELERLKEGS